MLMSKHPPGLFALVACLLAACAGTLEVTIDLPPPSAVPTGGALETAAFTQAAFEEMEEVSGVSTLTSAAPDLTIASMYLESEGRRGDCWTGEYLYGVRVVVRNAGDRNATVPFIVELDDLQYVVEGGLSAGNSVELHFPGMSYRGRYLAFVDVTHQVVERDENNNTLLYDAPTPSPPPPCTATPAAFTTPAAFLAGAATQVVTGWAHTCALLIGGRVKCWGGNDTGQLGDGTRRSSPFPVDVIDLPGEVNLLASGTHHTCAVAGSRVVCWGRGSEGQLDGKGEDSPEPLAVLGLSNSSEGVVSIAAGNSYNCALVWRGFVRCWGDNSSGELGNGTFSPGIFPVEVSGITDATAITGSYSHTCALTREGRVYCWGFNGSGPGPLGSLSLEVAMSNTPVEVIGLADPGERVTAITAGQYHTCALLEGGRVKCWGDNQFGQLGDGTDQASAVPVEAAGLSGVVQIEAGGLNTCAVLVEGSVKCWGHNGYGQVGNGTVTNQFTPAEVTGLTGVSALSVGYYYVCAVTNAGQILCWGMNDRGQLGRAGMAQSLVPIEVDWFYDTAGDTHTPPLVPTP
jgi:alpha-tubulin suppressor-like RCC1 family protein